MRERIMQLPTVVRQIGKVTKDDRVYIEDYAYSYLKMIKDREEDVPVRAALYGRTINKDNIRFYLIYGVSCVVEELQNGMTQDRIAQKYFSDYQLIGYVNLYHKENFSEEKEGCCIFYETNEAMQNYLLDCQVRWKDKQQYEEVKQKRNVKVREEASGQDFFVLMKEILWKFLMGIMVLVVAVTVSAINHYERMCEFAVVVMKAAGEVP